MIGYGLLIDCDHDRRFKKILSESYGFNPNNIVEIKVSEMDLKKEEIWKILKKIIKGKDVIYVSWNFLHVLSTKHQDIEMVRIFVKCILLIISSFQCASCRPHAKNFLDSNPIEIRVDFDLVKWCIDYHNDVNGRIHIGKILDYETSLKCVKEIK